MPTSDPIDILLAQDRWATANVIEACRTLSHDQFHRSFDMGPGSLHDTITHILSALQGWTDALADREGRPRLEGTERSIDELAALHQSLADELSAVVAAHPRDELITRSRGGRSFTFVRSAVVVHVTTHGMHHRAQCLNMLRHVGADPLPHSSVVEWMMMADTGS